MLRKVGSVLFLLGLMGFSLSPALADSSDELKRANKLRCAGNHSEAIELCTRIIESEKDDQRILRKAYMQRAFNYGRLERYDRAIADMDRVVEMKPDRSSSYSARARMYRQAGELDRAIADFSRSLDLRRNAGTLEDRGDCYAAKGDKKRAIADYGGAIEKAALKDSRKRLQEKIDALR